MQRKHKILAGIAVAFWLLFWANDVGVLVLSLEDPQYRAQRTCYYVIGFTVVRVPSTDDRPIYRCPLLNRV